MEKLAEYREKLRSGNPNNRIIAISDNMIYVDETKDLVTWDDENQMVYVLKGNEDHRDPGRPFKVQILHYDNIQYLEVTSTKNGIKEVANAFNLNAQRVDELLHKLSTIEL